jgi:PleD family two-component response regulator
MTNEPAISEVSSSETPQSSAVDQPSVLIVDSSADNREVLRTALARRGLRVFQAEDAEDGLKIAVEQRPDVVVLDLDSDQEESVAYREQFAEHARDSEESVIVLGRVRRGPVFTGGHVMSKPYHYAPLVHTIERLAAKAA